MTLRSIVPFGWGSSTLPSRASNNDPFVRLWNDVDQLFSNMVRGTGLGDWQPTGNIGLPMEIYETGNEVKVVAELPGVEEKDVSVELAGNVLTLRGEKKSTEERKEEGYHLAERRYGNFSRTLRLPFEVEADKVEAVFKNGVLTITMPKPAELQQQVKRIEVKAAA
jgi:HSP20 family protein